LRRALARCREFSDAILLLDDRSTDATSEIAAEMGCVVRTRGSEAVAWGAESFARSELWAFACAYATEPDDWVLICDADMLLHGDPRPLCESEAVTAWAWPLYDLWSETEYRSDGFWQGHLVPRVWLLRPNTQPPDYAPIWPDKALHCGHFPCNMGLLIANAPPDVYWLHYSYARPEHREEKARQYLANAHVLSEFERQHAASILDPQTPP
jgi:hypothetical protein